MLIGAGKSRVFFHHLATDFDGFLPHAERSVKKGEFDREKKDEKFFNRIAY
jgi:hypothetical protein